MGYSSAPVALYARPTGGANMIIDDLSVEIPAETDDEGSALNLLKLDNNVFVSVYMLYGVGCVAAALAFFKEKWDEVRASIVRA